MDEDIEKRRKELREYFKMENPFIIELEKNNNITRSLGIIIPMK